MNLKKYLLEEMKRMLLPIQKENKNLKEEIRKMKEAYIEMKWERASKVKTPPAPLLSTPKLKQFGNSPMRKLPSTPKSLATATPSIALKVAAATTTHTSEAALQQQNESARVTDTSGKTSMTDSTWLRPKPQPAPSTMKATSTKEKTENPWLRRPATMKKT